MKYMVTEQEKIIIDTSKEMTMQEYAKYLGIPYATIRTWVNRKQILYRKVPQLNDIILVQVGTEKNI
jgi:DNA-binding transcriptional regulator YiaG